MTIEDFIKKFDLPFSNFSVPTQWQDGFGFSTTQDYGDGYASLYKFGIYKQGLEKDLKEVSVSVSYGKKLHEGISLGKPNKGIWDPIDLNFSDEFFYDEKQNKFFHRNKEIFAKDILLYIERIHQKPTMAVKGFLLRIRLGFWRKALPGLIKILDIVLIVILWLISGEKIDRDILKRFFSERREERNNQKISEIEFTKGKTMEFFGYHAKRWSVVFYCSIHLIIYYFFFYLKNNHHLLASIGRNNFLALCYVVVSFAIVESLVPKIIKATVKKTPKIFTEIAFRNVQV